MDTTRTPIKTTDLVWRIMEDGTVIVSPEGGEVRVLNEVGSAIWQMIDGQNTVSNIIDLLTQEYNVSSDQAAGDVENFLAMLHERGLVIWSTN